MFGERGHRERLEERILDLVIEEDRIFWLLALLLEIIEKDPEDLVLVQRAPAILADHTNASHAMESASEQRVHAGDIERADDLIAELELEALGLRFKGWQELGRSGELDTLLAILVLGMRCALGP